MRRIERGSLESLTSPCGSCLLKLNLCDYRCLHVLVQASWGYSLHEITRNMKCVIQINVFTHMEIHGIAPPWPSLSFMTPHESAWITGGAPLTSLDLPWRGNNWARLAKSSRMANICFRHLVSWKPFYLHGQITARVWNPLQFHETSWVGMNLWWHNEWACLM